MPSLQQQAIKMTREAVDNLFRTSRHVPAEKRCDWVPMGEARSTQSQLQEVALAPYFFSALIKGEPLDFNNPLVQKQRRDAAAALATLEQAEDAARKNYETLYKVIAAVPDEDLEKQITLPWGTCTLADALFLAYWNTVYHIGQVNYIQLLLGDTQMH